MIIHSTELLVAAAQAFVGLGEQGGESCGQLGQVVELFLNGVRRATEESPERMNDRNAWSAAFIHHVGYWSHYDYLERASSWPLPAFADCASLAAYAHANAALRSDQPCHGDIYVQHSAVRRTFVRAGIVLGLTRTAERFRSPRYGYMECLVVDGNSGPCALVDGPTIVVTRRKLSTQLGDRFIRWTDLPARGAAAEGVPPESSGQGGNDGARSDAETEERRAA